MCTIEESINVRFLDDSSPVPITQWVEVDGIRFIKAIKSDTSIVRLLTGRPRGEVRSLARTNILETLVEKRNDAYEQIVTQQSAKEDKLAELGGEVESSNQKAKRRRTLAAAAMPNIVTLDAPGFGEVPGIQIKALLHRPSSPLWIELSTGVLTYLRQYAVAQICAGDVKQPRPGESRDAEQKECDDL